VCKRGSIVFRISSIGDGKLQKEIYSYVTMPGFLKPRLKAVEHALEEMIVELWPQSVNTVVNPRQFTGIAILAPRNEEADEINAYIIAKFPGQNVIYKSFDTISDGEAVNYPSEFLHTLCRGGMLLHELTLKENCPTILLFTLTLLVAYVIELDSYVNDSSLTLFDVKLHVDSIKDQLSYYKGS